MNKTLTIASREFFHNLRRPAFLFAVLGLPTIILLALLLVGIGAAREARLDGYGKIGYVDASTSQVLTRDSMPAAYPDLFVRYETSDAAAAVRAGDLAAYLELPAGYLESGRVTLNTVKPVPDGVRGAINAFLRANLTLDLPGSVAVALLTENPRLTVTVLDGNHTFSAEGAFFIFFLPLMFGFVLILTSVATSSFVMRGLVEEKTNRMIEVLITSVRPMELLLGKLLGLGALGLLQVSLFLTAAAFGLSAAQRSDLLVGLSIPVDLTLLAVLYYLLAYFLMASIGIAIGAIAGTEKESQQLSGFFIMPLMLPYPLMLAFILNPNGDLPILLSLIPFTSPMAILMRAGLTAVPLWQIAFSVVGLIILNILILRVAARLFRWGVLSTNKTPGPRQIYRILRGYAAETVITHPRQSEVA